MNALFETVKAAVLAVAVIKTASYGIWCFREKNVSGGIMLFFLCILAAALFIFNETRLYI